MERLVTHPDTMNWVGPFEVVDDLTPEEREAFQQDPAFYMKRWFDTATQKMIENGDMLTGNGEPSP